MEEGHLYLGEPIKGFSRKQILKEAQNGRRADNLCIRTELRELKKADLITVRVRHAVHKCYSFQGVA